MSIRELVEGKARAARAAATELALCPTRLKNEALLQMARGLEETAPEHNAPFVSFLASEAAGEVTGQIFGKGAPAANRYGFVIFNYSREAAEMVRDAPWTANDVAEHFGATLAPHLQSRTPAKTD